MKNYVIHWMLSVCVFNSAAQQLEVLTKFQEGKLISCEPAEAFFCGNVHVSCAGKTKIPTFPFTLQVSSREGKLMPVSDQEFFSISYSNSQVQWGTDAPYVVINPIGASGYIKIFQGGNYVFRYYPTLEASGLMSLGKCE